MLIELTAQLDHLHDVIHSWSLPWRLLLLLGWVIFGGFWTALMFRLLGFRPKGPPQLAEFLLCIFARAKDIDAIMGDFEELYERDSASGMDPRRVKVRYWARVIRSIGPQLWQFVRRAGLLGLIAAALRR